MLSKIIGGLILGGLSVGVAVFLVRDMGCKSAVIIIGGSLGFSALIILWVYLLTGSLS